MVVVWQGVIDVDVTENREEEMDDIVKWSIPR